MGESQTISLIVDASNEDGDTKGLFGKKKPERRELPIGVLKENLRKESEKLLAILADVPSADGWNLDEVEVGIDITVEGGVSFIGTATVAAAASLKLHFSRGGKQS